LAHLPWHNLKIPFPFVAWPLTFAFVSVPATINLSWRTQLVAPHFDLLLPRGVECYFLFFFFLLFSFCTFALFKSHLLTWGIIIIGAVRGWGLKTMANLQT